MDPRDRYFMTRQRLDGRRADAQRARLIRGDWTSDRPATPTLLRVEVSTLPDPTGSHGLSIARALRVLRLARAATDA